MVDYFSHFVYGKIISGGIDQSGFSVISKTKDLELTDIQRALPFINIGQIPNWDSFVPVFGLTEELDACCKYFSYTFKSNVIDPRRGYFPIQHCFLVSRYPRNLISFATQISKLTQQFDYRNPDFETKPLPIDFDDQIDEIFWNYCEENKGVILRILDRLFTSGSVVVITPGNDLLSRISIVNAIWLILPPSLRKKFSFHTNFYGSPEKTKSILKFAIPQPFTPSSQYALLDLRRNENKTTPYDIRTDYVKYLFHLINEHNLPFIEISSLCNNLISENGTFSSTYASLIADELENNVELPIFISKLRNYSSNISLDEIYKYIQKPQIRSNIEVVEAIWTYLNNQEDRYPINNFFILHIHDFGKIFLGNGSSLLENWIRHLIGKSDFKLLDGFLYHHEFQVKFEHLFCEILSNAIAFDVHFDGRKLTLMLESAIDHKTPEHFIKTILERGSDGASYSYTATFGYLRLLGGHKVFQENGFLLNKILEEVDAQNLIRLSILGLNMGYMDFLKPKFFLEIHSSPLTSQLFAAIENTADKILDSNLEIYDLGALNCAIIHFSRGLSKKLVPVKRLSESSAESKQLYSSGFFYVLKSINMLQKDAFSRLNNSLINNIAPFDHIQIFIALAKLTDDLEGAKYLLNQISNIFSYSANSSDWKQIGDELFELYSENKDVSTAFIQNTTIAYFRIVGELGFKECDELVRKLLSYSLPPSVIIDTLIKTFQQNRNIANIAEILYLLTITYSKDAEFIELRKLIILRLLMYIGNLTNEQLLRIEMISGDQSVSQTIKNEIWKRTLKKSPDEFIQLILLESKNKSGVELNKIANSIAGIWHPHNVYEINVLINTIEQENIEFSELLLTMILTGKIESSDQLRLELLSEKLVQLRQHLAKTEEIIQQLNKSQFTPGNYKELQSISLTKNYLFKKSSLYKALEELEKKIKPGWKLLG